MTKNKIYITNFLLILSILVSAILPQIALATIAPIYIRVFNTGGLVPISSTGAFMANIEFQSPQPNCFLSQLSLKRTGLGDVTDFESLSLHDGLLRISSPKAISRESNTLIFRLIHPHLLQFPISHLTLRANISPDAARFATHQFNIIPSQTKIYCRPITSPIIAQPDHKFSELQRNRSGTTGDLTLSRGLRTGKVYIGQQDAIFGSFDLRSSANHTVITAITFRQRGTAKNRDFANLYLVDQFTGQKLTPTVPSLVNNKALFVFQPPLRLDRHRKFRFSLIGDLVDGSSHSTIRFELEEPEDIRAYSEL